MSAVRGLAAAALVIVLGLLVGQRAEASDATEGAELYGELCTVCHGATGNADGPGSAVLKPTPRKLSDATIMRSISDQEIFDMINKGGLSVGKSPLMQSFSYLGDEKIRALVAHIRALCDCQYAPAAEPSAKSD